MTPETRYTALVEALLGDPGVTHGSDEPGAGSKFGSSGLKSGGRLFAMLVRGRLVVKLPSRRVDALVASGDGVRYDPRRDGRLMKEWLSLEPAAEAEWLDLAREAREFVASRR